MRSITIIPKHHQSSVPLACLTFTCLAALPLAAQTRTWNGSSNAFWGNSANWNEDAFTNGANVVMPGGAANRNNAIAANRAVQSITITEDALAYRIGTSNNNSGTATGHTLTFRNAGVLAVEAGNTANHSIGLNSNNAAVGSIVLAGTFSVNHNGTGVLSLTRPVTGGSGSLTKNGSGELRLTSANTYAGLTTINAGTLSLGAAGSIDSSSGVALSGGTFDVAAKANGYTLGNLSGSGSVLGAITISNELSIGTSPGTINFADLTMAATSNYVFDLTGGGTAADLANVSGTLTLSNASLDLIQLGSFTIGDKFTLFAYPEGNLDGTFDGLSNGATLVNAGGLWQIDYFDSTAGLNGGNGTSFVTITAIPEPAAAVLGFIGLFALLRRRRA